MATVPRRLASGRLEVALESSRDLIGWEPVDDAGLRESTGDRDRMIWDHQVSRWTHGEGSIPRRFYRVSLKLLPE